MILDFRNSPDQEALCRQYLGYKTFVGGVEVPMTWYIDTDIGLVRTYNVLGDHKAHLVREFPSMPSGCEDNGGGVVSKTIYGRVEMRAPDSNNVQPE